MFNQLFNLIAAAIYNSGTWPETFTVRQNYNALTIYIDCDGNEVAAVQYKGANCDITGEEEVVDRLIAIIEAA